MSTGDLAGPPLLDDDYVILSTVHSAKGGEWRVVHLIHAADGMFPSDMATGDAEGVEEERRLFYVALTRAREHLHIYAPLRYHHGGPFGRGDPHSYAQRTRFLPPEVDGLLEHRAVRASRADTPCRHPRSRSRPWSTTPSVTYGERSRCESASEAIPTGRRRADRVGPTVMSCIKWPTAIVPGDEQASCNTVVLVEPISAGGVACSFRYGVRGEVASLED